MLPRHSLRDALDRLHQTAASDPFERLSGLVDPKLELHPLHQTIERLVGMDPLTQSPDRSVIEDARRKWEESDGTLNDLTARHLRALCGDSEVATSAAFVRVLEQSGSLFGKRQWIERLIQSYFAGWGAIADQPRIERLLRKAVGEFTGRSPRIAKCSEQRVEVFSAKAHAWLAKQAIGEKVPPTEVLDAWKIPVGGKLGRAVVNTALEEWVKAFRVSRERKGPPELGLAACLQLRQTLLNSPLLDHALIGQALSEVLLWDHTAANDAFREDFLNFLLLDERFGDPRLPHNAGKWSSFDSTARAKAISWLARHDLLFFFNLVIDSDPHHRRDFWLHYIDQVEDSNVALCTEDEAKLLRATRLNERGSYSKIVGSDGVSAFLMRFRGAKGLVFIEFSEPNNALYVHDRETFDTKVGGIRKKSFSLVTDLKHYEKVNWFPHQANWREKVRSFLARHGIGRT